MSPRIAGAGQAVFAATFVGLGLAGLITHDFAAIWQPVPKRWPARETLTVVCALVALAAGLGMFWPRMRAMAAGALAAWLAVWMLLVKAPAIVATPAMAAAWESCGETAVLVAAAWALFAGSAGGWAPLKFAAGRGGLRLAHALYGLSMIAFGVAHLAYVKETAALVPSWLPAHAAWVYATGLAYIGAGVAILTGVLARLAATLSAVQIGAFTLLVWAPAAVSGHGDADTWSETVISWALTVAAWVVADSYRGRPWLRRRTSAGPEV